MSHLPVNPLTIKLQSDDTELLLEYVDEFLNIYQCIIDKTHTELKFYRGKYNCIDIKNLLETNDITFNMEYNCCKVSINNIVNLEFEMLLITDNDLKSINLLKHQIKDLQNKNEKLEEIILNHNNLFKILIPDILNNLDCYNTSGTGNKQSIEIIRKKRTDIYNFMQNINMLMLVEK